jgi:hypothetical protein
LPICPNDAGFFSTQPGAASSGFNIPLGGMTIEITNVTAAVMMTY